MAILLVQRELEFWSRVISEWLGDFLPMNHGLRPCEFVALAPNSKRKVGGMSLEEYPPQT